MEPISTMAGTVVGYLASILKKNKSFHDFTQDFSSAVVEWIRPLFLRDDNTPKDVLLDLQKKPDIQSIAKAIIEANIQENKDSIGLLKQMVSEIEKKEGINSKADITIIGSSKFVVGSKIDGDVYFGDNQNQQK